MSNKFTLEDYSAEVIAALKAAGVGWLYEASGELEAAAKRNTSVGKVGGGNTKQHWRTIVDEGEYKATVGNTEQTAIWLEFGTGDYAVNGDGRKGGWYIPIGEGPGQISQAVVDAYNFKVVYGKNGMSYAYTTGMKPQKPLKNAFDKKEPKIKKLLEEKMKGLGK
jgi:hypothetical protein